MAKKSKATAYDRQILIRDRNGLDGFRATRVNTYKHKKAMAAIDRAIDEMLGE
jgi:hypothetical protein